MSKSIIKNNKGFTLIEILVAVLILAILVAIALPTYNRAVERSRTSDPVNTLKSIAKAEQVQRLRAGEYTNELPKLDLQLTDYPAGNTVVGDTFEGQYYSYKVYGEDEAAATATRKGTNEGEEDFYELSVDYGTGELFCRPATNKTCMDLGLEEGRDHTPRPTYDTSHVETWNNLTMMKYVAEVLRPLWNSSCGATLDCLKDQLNQLCATNGKCLNQIGEYGNMYTSGGIMGSGFRWYMRDGKPVLGIQGPGEVGVGEVFFYSNGTVQLRGYHGTNNESWNEIEEYLGVQTTGNGSTWRFLTF